MYAGLASVYDRLSTINHTQWAEFLEQLFSSHGLEGKRILDLACGTGSMCKELAQRGYKPVGVDLAEDMLSVAESKLRGLGVPLYRADMRQLPPLGRFDAILCLSDSFNYLRDPEELRQVFLRLRDMRPQMLVFDLNTPYYLGQVLGDNSFHHVEEDIAYIWENAYDPAEGLCEMQITFFARDSKDKYIRFDEVHVERAFGLEDIRQMLTDCGWQTVQVYDGYTHDKPDAKACRWLFLVTPG